MSMINGIFHQVFNMSITAVYVILAILIVRLCFRRMPKNISFALWIVAGLRLVCPFSFSAPFSLFHLKIFSPVVAQVAYDHTMTFVTSDLDRIISSTINPVLPASGQSGQDSLLTAVPVVGAQISQWGWQIASVIWITGIAILLIIAIAAYIRIRRLVDSAVLLEGNVYEADKILSPFILGLFRPRIFIPFHLAISEQDYILRHERYHLRRGDHWLKAAAYLLLVLHWFNPMVWLAYYLMVRDMEMSCDEAVLNKMSDSFKYDYSSTLLSMAARKLFLPASPLAFGESNVRLRIKNILKFRKPKRWVVILAVTACLAITAACLANPTNLSQPTSTDQLEVLNEAIHAAILINNQNATITTDYQTEAHTILKTVDNKTQVTAYLVAMYLEYNLNNDGSFEKQYGYHMPIALTFARDTAGNLILSEFWIPTDGNDYGRSIQSKFPADIVQAALVSYTFSDLHERICEDNANAYFARSITSITSLEAIETTNLTSDISYVLVNGVRKYIVDEYGVSLKGLQSYAFNEMKINYIELSSKFINSEEVPIKFNASLGSKTVEFEGASFLDTKGHTSVDYLGGSSGQISAIYKLKDIHFCTLANIGMFLDELGVKYQIMDDHSIMITYSN